MKIARELASLVRKYLILNKKYIVQIFKFSGERDEIHAKFSSAIIEMQQKSSLKYMILEKKITAMREELNVKEAQLHASGITGLYQIPTLRLITYVTKEICTYFEFSIVVNRVRLIDLFRKKNQISTFNHYSLHQ